MSDKSDKSDRLSDKRSVRGIGDAEWSLATKAAQRGDRMMGEWLSEAIRAQVEREREKRDGPSDVLPTASANHILPLRLSPEQIVRNLDAYRRYLEMRGLSLSPHGKVMRAADRLMQEAMAEAGMPVPAHAHVRRIAGR